MRNRTKWLTLAVVVFTFLGRSRAATPIRIGMVPDAGATQVSVEEKAPLRDYLSRALGQPVELVIPTSYNATVEGMGNGSLDFAYFGGLTYCKAHVRFGVVPLVQRNIDRTFHALLITQADSSIHSLADLRGKRMAFGDINSTSGHLFAVKAMMAAGINPEKDLKWQRFTGSHAATIQAVASGAADAGSVDETVYKEMIADGKVDGKKLRVFYTTPPFPDYVWAARKDINPALQQRFAKAFLDLNSTRDAAILKILRAQYFVRADDAEYVDMRKLAVQLGLMEKQ
ncbi:MAG TPA: phosphate/phosphite/phosphonate ABC transporter substrate-binding protein [Acidobacteriaceae bacterium]|jgi:phosphonate transport system substrate-binding protein|nr:phosphate/phosphite/phosphonate ABC transporter substrate-binding protein [Acidobacteriaceae bacterium]